MPMKRKRDSAEDDDSRDPGVIKSPEKKTRAELKRQDVARARADELRMGQERQQRVQRERKPPVLFGGVLRGEELEQAYDVAEIPDVPDMDPDDKDPAYIQREADIPWPFSRPGWKPQTYAKLMIDNRTKYAEALRGLGKQSLWCEADVCCFETSESREIEIHPTTGFEMGKTVANYKNAGRPPIDHYKPDWVVRLDQIREVVEGRRENGQPLTNDDIRKMVEDRYHEQTLRITHKKCNLKRGKS